MPVDLFDALTNSEPFVQPAKEYEIFHGDCIPHMLEDMEPASMDMSVFSPPFPSLFAYTSESADIGNSEDLQGEAKIHLGYFYRGLARVLKPGRVAVVHVMQIGYNKRDGKQGLFDFRGLNIRLGIRAGLTYEYDWVVRKNPQAQAIRTRKWELKFQGLESDRAQSRGALPDYLIKFRAPGENQTPVDSQGEVSRNDWIDWAEACWSDIRETDTLNVAEGRGENDTKHICPLQLGVIERLVRLYSNPGETVFSPFAGIGSEGFMSLKLGRRFYGCELKNEYHAAALKNCDRAIRMRDAAERTLFDGVTA
jgi:DNA modification methylase